MRDSSSSSSSNIHIIYTLFGANFSYGVSVDNAAAGRGRSRKKTCLIFWSINNQLTHRYWSGLESLPGFAAPAKAGAGRWRALAAAFCRRPLEIFSSRVTSRPTTKSARCAPTPLTRCWRGAFGQQDEQTSERASQFRTALRIVQSDRWSNLMWREITTAPLRTRVRSPHTAQKQRQATLRTVHFKAVV